MANMNPYQSESFNLAMDRSQQEQFYNQDQAAGRMLQWQQYMQNSMMAGQNPTAAYYNQGMYFPQESLQTASHAANYGHVGSTERSFNQDRLGSITPGERTSPASLTSYHEKQEASHNQFSNEMLQFIATQQGRPRGVPNYSELSQRQDGAIMSPPKESSPSVPSSYVRTPELQANQYANEIRPPYMTSQPNSANVNYGGMNLSQEKAPTSSPEARNSPAVTTAYEVKPETLQSQYENEMMNYMTQIHKISNPNYIGTNSKQDVVSESPPVSKSSPAFTTSYSVKQEVPQTQHTNDMLHFPNTQQKVENLSFNPPQNSTVGTPEQRDSPVPPASPYVAKPDVASASQAKQMLQYMATQARDGGMSYPDRNLSEGRQAAGISAHGKTGSPSSTIGSFEVKQESPQNLCSKETLEYRYPQGLENQANFDIVNPKPEAKGSPFDESQERPCSANSYQIANPQMQSNVSPYQYGGFNPYVASQLASGQHRPQYPGNMAMSYYNQRPFAGSHMQGQGQMEQDSQHKLMLQQQQFYGVNPYPANYQMNVNTQRYFQQGMMGNQWQGMPENYGQAMGYGKRKTVDNGMNGIAMVNKKSRGYNDEDYDFELCNSWDEVTEVKDCKTGSNDGEDGENSQESEQCTVRTIFTYHFDPSLTDISHKVLLTEQRLCEELKRISFKKPILHIYNPLVYAFETHLDFVRRYCSTKKTVLFLGMNPGPFGMSQNGIPFGEVSIVRDWFNVKGQINKPSREHHKRQITGFQCQRSEVSGSRFWGLFKSICGHPDNFFKHCFVYNICPMAFISPTSKNITPAQLPVRERTLLYNACNAALLEILRTLDVKIVVAVGKFAEGQAMMVANDAKMTDLTIQSILHPSPINPAANRGWESAVLQQLRDMDVMKYFCVS